MTIPAQAKPNLHDVGSAREVIADDGTDTKRREGVVVALPTAASPYYWLVAESSGKDQTFRGHVDDAAVVVSPTNTQKTLQERVKRQASQGDTPKQAAANP